MIGCPPLLAISAGLLRNGKPVLGVICDPIPDVGYSAEEGSQLKINREVTRVTRRSEPANAAIALDFSSEMEAPENRLINIAVTQHLTITQGL